MASIQNQYGEQLIADRFLPRPPAAALSRPGGEERGYPSRKHQLRRGESFGHRCGHASRRSGMDVRRTPRMPTAASSIPARRPIHGAAGNGSPSGALGSSAAYVYNINTGNAPRRSDRPFPSSSARFIMDEHGVHAHGRRRQQARHESLQNHLRRLFGRAPRRGNWSSAPNRTSSSLVRGYLRGYFLHHRLECARSSLSSARRLSIVLSQTSLVSHASTDFDNVRLTATSQRSPRARHHRARPPRCRCLRIRLRPEKAACGLIFLTSRFARVRTSVSRSRWQNPERLRNLRSATESA